MTDIYESFSGRVLFFTGVTGFVGKVFLYKILKEFPDIAKIVVLVRPKKKQTPFDRFKAEVLASPAFLPLKKEIGEEEFARRVGKILPVAGDVMEDQLGLSTADYTYLTQEANLIVHLAATVDFQEKLNTSVKMNVLGSIRVMALAHKCRKLECFLHCSTCYVNFPRHGGAPIKETLYPLPFDAEAMAKYILTLDDAVIPMETNRLLKLYGYPNTYTFTKRLTEHILMQQKGNLPFAILRPSIIGAAWREPYQGWVDALTAAGGIFLTGGLGVFHHILCDAKYYTDLIPVDYVVNIALKAVHRTMVSCSQHGAKGLAAATTAPQQHAIGNAVASREVAVGSGEIVKKQPQQQQPTSSSLVTAPPSAPSPPPTSLGGLLLTGGGAAATGALALADSTSNLSDGGIQRVYQASTSSSLNPCNWETIRLSIIRYWSEHPHPKRVSMPNITIHNNRFTFAIADFYDMKLPLLMLEFLNAIPGLQNDSRKKLLEKYRRVVNRTDDLNKQFSPFTLNHWAFDAAHTDGLDEGLSPKAKRAFSHDIFDINWYHYGVAYSWGMISFIMKDPRPQPLAPPSGSELFLKASL